MSESDSRRFCNVDIVCANFNNSMFLEDFFESFLTLTVRINKLIFVDDGSKDNSIDIVNRYHAIIDNLEIVSLEENRGFANALNYGIERSTAEYIARMDPDDKFFPSRIECQYDYLCNNKADIVGSDAFIFHSENDSVIRVSNFPDNHKKIKERILSGEHGVLHPTVMAKSNIFKENRYIQNNVPAEDYDIFARALKFGAIFHNIKEPLIYYRVHQKSVSNALPFSTVRKTFEIRDSVFGTKTSSFKIWLYYVHIKNYRKFLFEKRSIRKFFFGFISCISHPKKACGMIFSFIQARVRNDA